MFIEHKKKDRPVWFYPKAFFLQNLTCHKLTLSIDDHKSSDYVLKIVYACEHSNNIIYYYILCVSIFPPYRNKPIIRVFRGI